VPELPEVETIARGLASTVTGKTIVAAKVTHAKSVVPADAARFVRSVAGERIEAVGRRGKFVVARLASGRSLVVHLRMTGRLIVQPAGTTDPYPYTRVRLGFADRTSLAFADVRKFGRMRLVDAGEDWDAELGDEPLDEAFTAARFGELLRGRTTPIKAFLLDQRHIAGVGNIYACEALWEAKIRPTQAAGALSRERQRRLHGTLRSVLWRAIGMGGTSARDYVDAEGMRGGFQNELAIYGRAGEACPRCSGPIVRTVLGQRGTWWCRTCQRR
jgi:formamidopyrimidine-DNA glycosylase